MAEGAYPKRNNQATPALSAGIIKATQTMKVGDMEAQITRWHEAKGTMIGAGISRASGHSGTTWALIGGGIGMMVDHF